MSSSNKCEETFIIAREQSLLGRSGNDFHIVVEKMSLGSRIGADRGTIKE
jgi:hypothetical protein